MRVPEKVLGLWNKETAQQSIKLVKRLKLGIATGEE